MQLSEKNKRLLVDKEWRMNNLYKIVDKESNLITFSFNEVQRDYYNNRHNRNIILKARQLGFSTFECVDSLDQVLFNQNFKAVIIAHDQDAMKKMFRKIKLAWDEFPQELKEYAGWKANTDNANELIFNNGSSVSVALSSRSDTVNKLHVSEYGKICKKYPEKAREIRSGAFPSVPKNGMISIESTAEGDYGDFYDKFWEAWENEPQSTLEFKAFFYNWANDNNYIMPKVNHLPEKYLKYQEEHKLSDEQIAWYYHQDKELRELMKQENPTTPEEAFEASGNKIFDQDILNSMMANSADGIKVGNWTYFADYIQGHNYALGADVAEGIMKDHSTIVIVDFSNRVEYVIVPKVVAIYKSNKIAPDDFAYEIKNGAVKYGSCIVAPEANGFAGGACIAKLKEIYSNIYQREIKDEYNNKKTKKLGFRTTASNKSEIIFNIKKAVEDQEIIIYSKPLLRELKSYDEQALAQLRYDEEVSNHFDLVMALAIAWEMRLHAHYRGNKPELPLSNYAVSEEPFDPYSII